MELPVLLIVIIVIALVFDYINGFHDSANAIATVISTKALTPVQAILWAALWNFAAFFIAAYVIGEFKIGNTIAETVYENYITLEVIFAGLVAAILWNLLTWWLAIPSSSSHTLIGGLLGAALMNAFIQDYNHVVASGAHAGFVQNAIAAYKVVITQDVIKFSKILPIVLFIFFAPLIGMIMGIICNLIIMNVFKKANHNKMERRFRKFQLVTSGLFSLSHGLNDAQKVMGVIGAAVIYFHVQMAHDPLYLNIPAGERFHFFTEHYLWVPLASFVVIGLGTMSGGLKIIKTMGTKITKITPLEGVSAETAGAMTLFLTDHFGIPVSTTHTITGSIIGVGLNKRVSAVRWGITVDLLWAWILTIPISAVIAAIAYLIVIYI